MRHLILGTAGHIDHGKTSLVRALTGVNTDRLPEEQRRGMTIDLGFADFEVEEFHFGVVDVPGHEKFVRTMVAGATGIDLALLVVAADDSVMPQTLEHIEILELLGLVCGVVALNKIDAVDPDLVHVAGYEIGELLAKTSLRDFPIVPVSALTGQGLDELRRVLMQQAAKVVSRDTSGPFRLGVDRVFTVVGRGTVVTGSVYSGQVHAGDNLELWPAGLPCRVRGLQSHGKESEILHVGQRAAVNVLGLEREQIERGCELATEGAMTPTHVLDTRLQLLSSCRKPLGAYRHVRLCLGTNEVLAVVVPSDRSKEILPGASTFAQLRTDAPVVAAYGQRFIIRDESANRTLGGGSVLRSVGQRRSTDPAEDLRGLELLAQGDEVERVAEVLRSCGLKMPTDLSLGIRTGVPMERLPAVFAEMESRGLWIKVAGTTRRVVRSVWQALEHKAIHYLDRFHRLHAGEAGCPLDSLLGWMERRSDRPIARQWVDGLIQAGRLKTVGSVVCLPQFAPNLSSQDEKVMAAMLAMFREAGFQPPSIEEVLRATKATTERLGKLLRIAAATRQLIEVAKGMYLAAACEADLRERVAALIRRQGQATVSEIKEALGSSRKYVVPFVEYLDRIGFTVRDGDVRRLTEPRPPTEPRP